MPSRSFAWIAPAVEQNDGKLVVSLAADLLQARGHHMDAIEGQVDAAGELPESILSPRCLRQIDGVLIFSARPSRELLANLRRRHLPVVLVNNHHLDIRLPTVLPDLSHAAFGLAEKCIQLGHRKIQLMLRADSLPASSAAQAGCQAAMQYYGLQSLPKIQVEAGFDWLQVLSGPSRPTALLCVSGQLASEVRRRAMEAALSLPADLSIGAICSPGESCAERDSITSYEFDPRRVLHWAAEFITEGLSPHGPQTAVIPGRLTDRGSIVPPADRPTASARPRGEAAF
jgi:LacI family transcriptional regulator